MSIEMDFNILPQQPLPNSSSLKDFAIKLQSEPTFLGSSKIDSVNFSSDSNFEIVSEIVKRLFKCYKQAEFNENIEEIIYKKENLVGSVLNLNFLEQKSDKEDYQKILKNSDEKNLVEDTKKSIIYEENLSKFESSLRKNENYSIKNFCDHEEALSRVHEEFGSKIKTKIFVGEIEILVKIDIEGVDVEVSQLPDKNEIYKNKEVLCEEEIGENFKTLEYNERINRGCEEEIDENFKTLEYNERINRGCEEESDENFKTLEYNERINRGCEEEIDENFKTLEYNERINRGCEDIIKSYGTSNCTIINNHKIGENIELDETSHEVERRLSFIHDETKPIQAEEFNKTSLFKDAALEENKYNTKINPDSTLPDLILPEIKLNTFENSEEISERKISNPAMLFEATDSYSESINGLKCNPGTFKEDIEKCLTAETVKNPNEHDIKIEIFVNPQIDVDHLREANTKDLIAEIDAETTESIVNIKDPTINSKCLQDNTERQIALENLKDTDVVNPNFEEPQVDIKSFEDSSKVYFKEETKTLIIEESAKIDLTEVSEKNLQEKIENSLLKVNGKDETEILIEVIENSLSGVNSSAKSNEKCLVTETLVANYENKFNEDITEETKIFAKYLQDSDFNCIIKETANENVKNKKSIDMVPEIVDLKIDVVTEKLIENFEETKENLEFNSENALKEPEVDKINDKMEIIVENKDFLNRSIESNENYLIYIQELKEKINSSELDIKNLDPILENTQNTLKAIKTTLNMIQKPLVSIEMVENPLKKSENNQKEPCSFSELTTSVAEVKKSSESSKNKRISSTPFTPFTPYTPYTPFQVSPYISNQDPQKTPEYQNKTSNISKETPFLSLTAVEKPLISSDQVELSQSIYYKNDEFIKGSVESIASSIKSSTDSINRLSSEYICESEFELYKSSSILIQSIIPSQCTTSIKSAECDKQAIDSSEFCLLANSLISLAPESKITANIEVVQSESDDDFELI